MTQETILANATLVLPGETVRGTLVLRDDVIAAMDDGTAVPKGGVGCGGITLRRGWWNCTPTIWNGTYIRARK